MTEQALLFMEQVTCAPDHLDSFNHWYNTRLLDLLRFPGCRWAQRYASLSNRDCFMALMGIRSEADLPSLFCDSPLGIRSLAGPAQDKWQWVEGTSIVLRNIYWQILGPPLFNPLLTIGWPLSVVTADIDPRHEDAWNRWYNESHIPNLLRIPGYLTAARFQQLDHPALAGVNTGPRYLALYECEGEDVVPALRYGPSMRSEARAELQEARQRWGQHQRTLAWDFYKMVDKYPKR